MRVRNEVQEESDTCNPMALPRVDGEVISAMYALAALDKGRACK
jgi:hypothetical protein